MSQAQMGLAHKNRCADNELAGMWPSSLSCLSLNYYLNLIFLKICFDLEHPLSGRQRVY